MLVLPKVPRYNVFRDFNPTLQASLLVHIITNLSKQYYKVLLAKANKPKYELIVFEQICVY